MQGKYFLLLLTLTACKPESENNALTNSDASPQASHLLSQSLASDFISEVGRYPSVHSATITELPNKTLMSCWYAGSKEGGDDVQIYCRTQDLATDTWSNDVITAVGRQERVNGNMLRNSTVGNPVVYYNDGDKTVYMFYVVRTFGGWSTSAVAYKSSPDLGKTWTNGFLLEGLSERRFGGKLTRSLAIKLSDNKILLPMYYELEIGDSFANTGYTCQLDLNNGKVKKSNCLDIPVDHQIQPTVVQVGNKLFAYMRNASEEKKITSAVMDLSNGYSAQSEWVKTPSLNLPNPNSSIAAAVTSDNKILLAYNNTTSTRNILSLASATDGQNFKEIFTFEKGEPNEEYSYPTLFQDSNKVFHLAYTYKRLGIKHIKFTEQWISAQENAR